MCSTLHSPEGSKVAVLGNLGILCQGVTPVTEKCELWVSVVVNSCNREAVLR